MKLEGQEFCCFWCKQDEEVPIGKVVSLVTMPYPDVYELAWHGTCLGNDVKAASAGEACMKMISMARERNLLHVTCRAGYGVTTIYTPAFEE